MPLYTYKCEVCGSDSEVLRNLHNRDEPVACSCGGSAPRFIGAHSFAIRGGVGELDAPEPDYVQPSKRPGAKKVLDRAGGGKAIRNDETGGYRPAITHNTKCPKCGKMRNVAVMAVFPYGKRVVCEACAYFWIHQTETAEVPLRDGVQERFRPSKVMSNLGPSHYEAPERGA